MGFIEITEAPKWLRVTDNATYTLDEMQKFVGGYIECLTLRFPSRAVQLIINEEGVLLGLPQTVFTELWGPLRGNILIGAVDGEGDFVPLTPDEMRRFCLVTRTQGQPDQLPVLHIV